MKISMGLNKISRQISSHSNRITFRFLFINRWSRHTKAFVILIYEVWQFRNLPMLLYDRLRSNFTEYNVIDQFPAPTRLIIKMYFEFNQPTVWHFHSMIENCAHRHLKVTKQVVITLLEFTNKWDYSDIFFS